MVNPALDAVRRRGIGVGKSVGADGVVRDVSEVFAEPRHRRAHTGLRRRAGTANVQPHHHGSVFTRLGVVGPNTTRRDES